MAVMESLSARRRNLAAELHGIGVSLFMQLKAWELTSRAAIEEDNVAIWEEAERVIATLRQALGLDENGISDQW